MDIDYLHDAGYMPDRFYYQLNGGSLHDNYHAQKRKKKQEDDIIKRYFDLFLMPMIRAGLKTTIDSALDEILGELKK